MIILALARQRVKKQRQQCLEDSHWSKDLEAKPGLPSFSLICTKIEVLKVSAADFPCIAATAGSSAERQLLLSAHSAFVVESDAEHSHRVQG